jgi:hypothetical protein
MKQKYEDETSKHFFFKNIDAEMRKYSINFHKKISSKYQSRVQLETMLQEILNEHYIRYIASNEPKISLNKKGMSIFSQNNHHSILKDEIKSKGCC